MRTLILLFCLVFTFNVGAQTDSVPPKQLDTTVKIEQLADSSIVVETPVQDTTTLKVKDSTAKNVVKAKPKEEPKDSVKITAGRLISILESARGCRFDDKGKWCSSPNRIPYSNSDYNNEFYEKYRIGTENFRQIRIMEMKVNNELYYALIWQKTAGYYTDPDSMFDWKYFTAADYYIFEKEDFKKLLPDTMKFGKPYEVSLRVKYAGTIPYTSTSQFESRIHKDVNDYLRIAHLYDTTVRTFYQFSLYPISDKRGKYMRFNTWLGYATTGGKPESVPFSTFKEHYYELPYESFRAFAKP